jgi:hypothetical protein
MTTLVKRLVISGFRGIPGRLDLDFCDGGKPKSMLLYGRNGTGKSSISDGWEWLTTGKIDHLAREGAKEGSYPNKGAVSGEIFVEAEFFDPNLGKARLDFDLKKVTKPKPSGSLDAVRSMIKHACHIRHGDLAQFVFLTKSERYDALARLMGFVPQMEYQKALRRVEGQLEKEVDRLRLLKDKAYERRSAHFSGDEQPLEQISAIATARGFEEVSTLSDADSLVGFLRKAVEQDPRAVKLAGHGILQNALGACNPPSVASSDLESLSSTIGELLADRSDEVADQLRIPFLMSASRLLQSTEESGFCPLCGQEFDGDLQEHIAAELAKLDHLKGLLDQLSAARTAVATPLATYSGTSAQFEKALESAQPNVDASKLDSVKIAASDVDECIGRVRDLLTFDSSEVSAQLVSALKGEGETLESAITALKQAKSDLLAQSKERSAALETDPSRVKLVEDAGFVRDGVKLLKELQEVETEWTRASDVLDTYRAAVGRYVAASLDDVQSRFDLISGRVKTCFEALEKRTPGIGEPRLKLLPDQDRSVVLEVMFHGEEIHPAYKYLSESQLNSFGLAVFLASATHFNQECRLLILDDVVNSFDAYKRPLLIELLKEHFADRQILLMTHDRFWRDLLMRRLPDWGRIEFVNYKPGQGPTVQPGLSRLEEVAEDLTKDRPEAAARCLADHIDNVLQDVCERFEVELKFNRRNEHTLDTLIDRLRVRLGKKLGQEHPVTKDVAALLDANAYRNWVSHCKSPESPIDVDEVREVRDLWDRIEKAVTCQESACAEILSWDGKSRFACGCGATCLEKPQASGVQT